VPDEPQPLTKLERLQAKMREEQSRKEAKKKGNPNLQKGVKPYNITPASFEEWMNDHLNYEPKNGFKFTDIVRMFLHGKERKYRCPEEKRRVQLILEALYKRATDVKSPLQVAAAQLLFNRGYGREQSADADLKAIQKGGLTLVYVDRNKIDPEIPVVEEDQKALPEPEFIDAEIVEEGESHGIQ
jgi:hypothetical protein